MTNFKEVPQASPDSYRDLVLFINSLSRLLSGEMQSIHEDH
ncbi:hypothetical protein [Echinicola shivajiensis]|nr:hypothetical protein [Echinicola shivajiensis]